MRITQALVACSDLLGFAKISNNLSEEQIYHFVTDYYEFVGDAISKEGGKVIKFMGDATLILFPDHLVDAGIRALFALQSNGDRYLTEQRFPSRHRIRAHYGPVQEAELGTRSEKRPDILGATVNKVFLQGGADFSISEEVFAKLSEDSKGRFQLYRPQVIYVPTT